MSDRTKKIALQRELFANNAGQVLRNLVELLDIFIEESREANDTVDDGRLLGINQGKIEGYKHLRDIILKEPPPKDSSKGINLT